MKETIALSNAICGALGILPTRNFDGLAHGSICLANDSLFSQATFQQEITTFGIGYADPNRNALIGLLNYLAPTRPGPRNAIVTVYDETEPFESVDYKAVKRSELGDFAIVKQRTSTKVTRKVVNRGLSIVLDNDQLKDKPNWRAMHTMWLIDLLTRASILEVLALYAAFASTDTYVWNAEADPDMDVQHLNTNILAPATGFKANRLLVGEVATLVRKTAYRAQETAGGFASAGLNDGDLATALNLASVRVNAERYNNGGTKDTFLGSKFLLYTAQDAESPEDNSNVVRHVSNTDFGGGQYATYVEERLKKTIITVENYELFATQHTGGAALITVAGS